MLEAGIRISLRNKVVKDSLGSMDYFKRRFNGALGRKRALSDNLSRDITLQAGRDGTAFTYLEHAAHNIFHTITREISRKELKQTSYCCKKQMLELVTWS